MVNGGSVALTTISSVRDSDSPRGSKFYLDHSDFLNRRCDACKMVYSFKQSNCTWNKTRNYLFLNHINKVRLNKLYLSSGICWALPPLISGNNNVRRCERRDRQPGIMKCLSVYLSASEHQATLRSAKTFPDEIIFKCFMPVLNI